MAPKLSINLNAIAMIRNRRNLPWPNIIHIGRIALRAGAFGLTVHPRPDQRHIRFSDLPDIRQLLDTEFPNAELNVEGYPCEEFMALCRDIKPEQVTLVPDKPDQLTSDHGWDFIKHQEFLSTVVSQLKALGSNVSLFANADGEEKPLKAAKATQTDQIELYTGPYGGCFNNSKKEAFFLEKLAQTADIANRLSINVNAGHDLTVNNIPTLIKRIPYLFEISVGHAFAADAFEYGTKEAVLRLRHACGHTL
ncbi:Pyridoxine 5'-phosphate synthase [Liberibacter crescens BT-1]|uniref:Pyridoxine 5'-phosphate synthase n=1 Tax=Liberibacter crescens (strain BT-1) TaxID=1215343 RepID=L0ETH9_LIBCB|nr:pyridoxine 5'-phosphate synthase [Liberibacter crescens]AGA64130.1 Pyridoxine 5'-phosphate synthase [Liberibacter crescens BT-1]AMC12406.1 pyridoxine 5'-phosphate synthase [Liberibacter crescens]